VDLIRSYAPGFIFTTSLPPASVAGALASVRHLKKSNVERERHQEVTQTVKERLGQVGIPYLKNPAHIVPVMVCDAPSSKRASDQLLVDHRIYVQAINFPTVPRGQERLRITPSPYHTKEMIDQLVSSLIHVWKENQVSFLLPLLLFLFLLS